MSEEILFTDLFPEFSGDLKNRSRVRFEMDWGKKKEITAIGRFAGADGRFIENLGWRSKKNLTGEIGDYIIGLARILPQKKLWMFCGVFEKMENAERYSAAELKELDRYKKFSGRLIIESSGVKSAGGSASLIQTVEKDLVVHQILDWTIRKNENSLETWTEYEK